jgi:hypothetical protein
VLLQLSVVSIEGRITGGYPNGRVFGGPNLAIGPWEERGTSVRIVWMDPGHRNLSRAEQGKAEGLGFFPCQEMMPLRTA